MYYYVLSVTFMTVGGWISAYARNDPEIFRRTGALIAAVAALMIIFQIAQDMRLEKVKEELEKKEQDAKGEDDSELFGRYAVSSRIRKRGQAKAKAKMRAMRLSTAIFAASFAALGELIHGFGDLLVPSCNLQLQW